MPFNPSSIDELLEAANITQTELAQELGTKQPSISRLASGIISPTARTIDALYKVAAKYDISNINFYLPPEN